MRMKAAVAVVACAVSVAAVAQGAAGLAGSSANAVATTKAFEVASVRKSQEPDMQTIFASLRQARLPGSARVDGSRATYTYQSLKQLVAYAYNLRLYEVTGPEWMLTDHFDITAKLPEGAKADDAPEMVRAMLKERFRLAAHTETKDAPVLGLMAAKGGPKLTDSTATPEEVDFSADLKAGESRRETPDGPVLLTRNPDGSTTYHMGQRGKFTLGLDMETRSMHLTGTGMSMRGLALMITTLGGGGGREVVDQTGLTGRYDVALEFSLMDMMQSLQDQGIQIPRPPGAGAGAEGSASDPGGSTLSSTLGKVGLRLEKSHAVVERLMVDHVEQEPTEQ